MSGMSVTPIREVRVAFTQSYFLSGQAALIRREDAARFATGPFSLATAEAIGAIKNTTGEYYVETQFSGVKRKFYKNAQDAVKDLIKKEIDIFVHDAPMVFYLASENETRGIDVLKFSKLYALFTREPLAWAVRKNDPELLKSANEFLKFFNEQGKLIPLIKSRIPHAE
jgi:polar amino acid transport system substrate-binding protein